MSRLRLRLPELRLPAVLQVIPRPALALIVLLVVVNIAVWVVCGIVLHFFPKLVGPAVLSYTLGLRHALDADHISAIDLMTRRLIASGQRPASVGTFFSLGHSTIVIITCVVVAATSGALRDRFDNFQRVGNIVGTSVSAAVLLILCAGNSWVLWNLVGHLRRELALQRRRRDGDAESIAAGDGVDVAADQLGFTGGGFLTTVFRRLFLLIDRPWKMFPLGVMFGLGFDTSSEVAILGIASIQGAEGVSLWLILIFPALFTAGMCLIDTSDGALMMSLYTSKAFSRDKVAILYYSIVLTGITVVVSAFIGIIQLLSLVQNVANPDGSFWDGVSAIGDSFDIVGGSICSVFLLAGIGSVIIYGPWRRRMERRDRLAAAASSPPAAVPVFSEEIEVVVTGEAESSSGGAGRKGTKDEAKVKVQQQQQ